MPCIGFGRVEAMARAISTPVTGKCAPAVRCSPLPAKLIDCKKKARIAVAPASTRNAPSSIDIPTMSRTNSEAPRRKRALSKATQIGTANRTSSPSGKTRRSPTATTVLRQFRELFRVSQQHFQRIESNCGVSGAQLWALSEVSEVPGITVSQLARAMSTHLSTSSNLLDKLEAQGFVRRERASDDQRIVRIHLTSGGLRILKKAPHPVEGVIPDALAKMPEKTLRSLQRDLAQLLGFASLRNPKAALEPLAEP